MGGFASCVERVNKRQPDGPLVPSDNPQSSLETNRHTPPSTSRTRRQDDGVTATSVQIREEDRPRRRRPTVAPEVAQRELDRYRLEQSTGGLMAHRDNNHPELDYKTEYAKRVTELQEMISMTAKYKTGIFDKPVTFTLDTENESIRWVSAGHRPKELGYVRVADVRHLVPHKKEDNYLDLQCSSHRVETFGFSSSTERQRFENGFESIRRFFGYEAQ